MQFNRKNAAVAALLALSSVPSLATVRYEFSGFNAAGIPTGAYENPISFVFETASFIDSTSAPIDAAELVSCNAGNASCAGVQFYVNAVLFPGSPVAEQLVTFSYREAGNAFSSTSFHYFAAAAFLAPGTYSTIFAFNPATLQVSVVPEPQSALLLLAGLAATLSAARRMAPRAQ